MHPPYDDDPERDEIARQAARIVLAKLVGKLDEGLVVKAPDGSGFVIIVLLDGPLMVGDDTSARHAE